MKDSFYRNLFWRAYRWAHRVMNKNGKIRNYEKNITLLIVFAENFSGDCKKGSAEKQWWKITT